MLDKIFVSIFIFGGRVGGYEADSKFVRGPEGVWKVSILVSERA